MKNSSLSSITHNVPGEKDTRKAASSAFDDACGRAGKDSLENRSQKLQSFVAGEAWLWANNNATGLIAHERLLVWMKAPHPKDLVRFFRLWGCEDIFKAITRKSTSRDTLRLGVQGLVDLRNNIAHGDYSAQATQQDVREYMRSIKHFCVRVDRHVGHTNAKLLDAMHVPADILLSGLGPIVAMRDIIPEVHEALHAKP